MADAGLLAAIIGRVLDGADQAPALLFATPDEPDADQRAVAADVVARLGGSVDGWAVASAAPDTLEAAMTELTAPGARVVVVAVDGAVVDPSRHGEGREIDVTVVEVGR